jgi:chemotaxis signal transduction protein
MNDQLVSNSERQILVITFMVGGSLFGMETASVQEVVRLGAITPVHHAIPCVIGVMNLRGHISTVVDLATRLGLVKNDLQANKRIIIVEWLNERVGLVVDQMQDVLSIDVDSIGPAPENVRSAQSNRMKGVFRSGEHIIAMLDLDKVLGMEDEMNSVGQVRESS